MVAIAAAALAIFLLLNVGGWGTLIQAKLFRIDNQPVVVPPPSNFQPQVPDGFKVSVFAKGFTGPRWLAVAPNGDVFLADSSAGEVVVLHDSQRKGSAESRDIFADHLNLPFGIAFHDDYVYVANTNEVLRFRYHPKTSKRLGDAEHILDLRGWATTSIGRDRWPLVLMAKGFLCRLDRKLMSRSSLIPAVPQFWLRTLMGRTCESTRAGCEMRWELPSTPSLAACGQPSMNGTTLATTSRQTTSPVFWTVAFTDGPTLSSAHTWMTGFPRDRTWWQKRLSRM